MINYPFANAKHEGGPKEWGADSRRGIYRRVGIVITANPLDCRVNHGLGIIFNENSRAEEFITPICSRLLFLVSVFLNVRIGTTKRNHRQTSASADVNSRLRQGFRSGLAGVLGAGSAGGDKVA